WPRPRATIAGGAWDRQHALAARPRAPTSVHTQRASHVRRTSYKPHVVNKPDRGAPARASRLYRALEPVSVPRSLRLGPVWVAGAINLLRRPCRRPVATPRGRPSVFATRRTHQRTLPFSIIAFYVHRQPIY